MRSNEKMEIRLSGEGRTKTVYLGGRVACETSKGKEWCAVLDYLRHAEGRIEWAVLNQDEREIDRIINDARQEAGLAPLPVRPRATAPSAAAVVPGVLTATVWVNDQPYVGESLDEGEPVPAPHLHSTSTAPGPATRGVLCFGGEPKRIVGMVGLRSHMERILTRIKEGSIPAGEIVIRFGA